MFYHKASPSSLRDSLRTQLKQLIEEKLRIEQELIEVEIQIERIQAQFIAIE